ncbi:MAG: hypothetical protein DMG12_13680 [Acidobacteria bacterium]|nr:MAG: hypothetical protein DMG12_13680 [Acidobacteriota bacterium]
MAKMADMADVKIGVAAPPPDEFAELSPRMRIGSVLGPLVGLALWFIPMQVEPVAHHTLAIVAFMIVYWITEPIDHGVTAMIGCFLFWALHIADFETAFAGFADSAPWFLFGAMLMGEAAAQSGLAKRIGLFIMHYLGTSYSRLLLSVVVFVFVLNFLVPSGLAQLAIVAPMIIGVVAGFGVGPQSNIARGLFVILAYTCGLFNKMILAGGASILTRGIVEKLTGEPIFWSKYFIAYLPADLITIFACWLTILWLYPPEKKELPGGRQYLEDWPDGGAAQNRRAQDQRYPESQFPADHFYGRRAEHGRGAEQDQGAGRAHRHHDVVDDALSGRFLLFSERALLDGFRLSFCPGQRAFHVKHIPAGARELRRPARLQPGGIGHGLELRLGGEDVRLPVGSVDSGIFLRVFPGKGSDSCRAGPHDR